MENVVLNNGVLSVTISTYGAEVVSAIRNGKEMVWQGSEKFWTGHSPLLFPVCGAFRDFKYEYKGNTYEIPPHGFTRKSNFEITSKSENSVTMTLIQSAENKAVYPFEYDFVVTYSIKENQLTSVVEVKNNQSEPMYFSFGSHESFNLEGALEEYSVELENEEVFLSPKIVGRLLTYENIDFGSGKVIKLEKQLFKYDTFMLRDISSRKLFLRHGDKIIAQFDYDASNLLIWQPVGAPFICIEPWFRAPDYIDTCHDITKKPKMIKVDGQKSFTSTRTVTYF